jgi:hypothetical protein
MYFNFASDTQIGPDVNQAGGLYACDADVRGVFSTWNRVFWQGTTRSFELLSVRPSLVSLLSA